MDCNEWVCYGENCPLEGSTLDLKSFLKHVSHKKSCLGSYDPQYLNYLKRESKLKSKREWFKRNWDSRIKEERNLMKERGITTSNQVGLNERVTSTGKAFYRLFAYVFKNHKHQIKARIETLSNMPTMDLKSLDSGQGNTNEERFKLSLKEIFNERKKISAAKLNEIVMHGFLKHCMDRAFCDYLNDRRFIEMFCNAQDNALEKIFSELITAKYFPNDANKLEAKMTEAFDNLVSKELEEKSKDCNLCQDMCLLIDEMLEKKLKDFFPDLQKF